MKCYISTNLRPLFNELCSLLENLVFFHFGHLRQGINLSISHEKSVIRAVLFFSLSPFPSSRRILTFNANVFCGFIHYTPFDVCMRIICLLVLCPKIEYFSMLGFKNLCSAVSSNSKFNADCVVNWSYNEHTYCLITWDLIPAAFFSGGTEIQA